MLNRGSALCVLQRPDVCVLKWSSQAWLQMSFFHKPPQLRVNRPSFFSPSPLPQICTELFYRANSFLGRAGSTIQHEPKGHEAVPWSSWAVQESSSHQPDKSHLMTDSDTEFKGVYTYRGSAPLGNEGDSNPRCNSDEPRENCAK